MKDVTPFELVRWGCVYLNELVFCSRDCVWNPTFDWQISLLQCDSLMRSNMCATSLKMCSLTHLSFAVKGAINNECGLSASLSCYPEFRLSIRSSRPTYSSVDSKRINRPLFNFNNTQLTFHHLRENSSILKSYVYHFQRIELLFLGVNSCLRPPKIMVSS